MKKALLIIVILLVVGALVYLGFFYYKPSSTPAPEPAPAPTPSNEPENKASSISILNNAFDPPQLTVKAGTSVTWTNNDSVTHTVAFDSFDSGDIESGGTYSHTFPDKGTFDYHCSIHPNMTGSVIVQ
jgi:plastocyanin